MKALRAISSVLALAIPSAYCDLRVQTVTGPVAVEELGRTLTHEHVLVDFIGAAYAGPHRYEVDDVLAVSEPAVRRAAGRGVRTIVECTPAYLARDPELLQRLARDTGVNFVTNTGLYGAANDRFLPPYAFKETAEELAARWIVEANDGIGGTRIKPGLIKLGVDDGAELSAVDHKLIEAGALAHRVTGLTIAVRTGRGPGVGQFDILADQGVDASAWIWVHAQSAPKADILSAAERGAWISLDGFRPNRSSGTARDAPGGRSIGPGLDLERRGVVRSRAAGRG